MGTNSRDNEIKELKDYMICNRDVYIDTMMDLYREKINELVRYINKLEQEKQRSKK